VPAPSYFDFLIEGFRAGHAGRHVHLGYWDDPPPLTAPCGRQEFAAAQARLTDILIGLADVHGGQTVLDVGCGFGGTLEALGKWPDMRLSGINIDRRQLDICRSLALGDNTPSLIVADACALPFRSEAFDRVFCVEAMFHFRAREVFLREAASVLRRGGRLVVSDILLRAPAEAASLDVDTIEAAIRNEYGPWPRLWVTADEIVEAARHAGLKLDRVADATRQTLPTYRMIAPQEHQGLPSRLSAGSVLRWLHGEGYLSYVCMSFEKR
jgi:cyclopropane fatty-acyl-phospholipid synthase-like methyltransferase